MNRNQLHKRLAISGAILAVVLFVAANAHLITVAILSQPESVPPVPGHTPAAQSGF